MGELDTYLLEYPAKPRDKSMDWMALVKDLSQLAPGKGPRPRLLRYINAMPSLFERTIDQKVLSCVSSRVPHRRETCGSKQRLRLRQFFTDFPTARAASTTIHPRTTTLHSLPTHIPTHTRYSASTAQQQVRNASRTHAGPGRFVGDIPGLAQC